MSSNGNSVCRLLHEPAVQAVNEGSCDPLVFVPGLLYPQYDEKKFFNETFEKELSGGKVSSCTMMCGNCDEYSVTLHESLYPGIFSILKGLGVLDEDFSSEASQKGLTFDSVLHHLESYIKANVASSRSVPRDPL